MHRSVSLCGVSGPLFFLPKNLEYAKIDREVRISCVTFFKHILGSKIVVIRSHHCFMLYYFRIFLPNNLEKKLELGSIPSVVYTISKLFKVKDLNSLFGIEVKT